MALHRPGLARPLYILLCLIVSTTSTHVHAEETELEDVTVEGEGVSTETTPTDFTVSATTVEMDSYQNRSVSVAEVLDEVVGVRVKQFGGLDDYATVSIRGSTGEQVQIYLDGIPLNQAAGGAVDLSSLPVELIESMTIYRGQAPARFDSSAIGGVVAIKTHRAQKKRRIEIHNSYGSLNTYKGSVLYAETFGSTGLLLSYQHARSNGDFSHLDDNGTPANSTDDQVITRANNEFAKNNFLFRLHQAIRSDLDFEFSNNFFREDRGVPGLRTLRSDNADLSTTRNISQVKLGWRPTSRLTFSMNPFFSFNKSQFSDLQGEIGLGRQDNDDNTFLYGTRLLGEYYWGAHQHISVALSYTGEQFHPENFLAIQRTGQASMRNRISLSAEDEISLWQDRVIINPMLRTEFILNDLTGEDPSLASAASANHSTKVAISGKIGTRVQIIDNLNAFANFGRNFRVPSFLELFGDRGATVGNPDLRPESSWNYDVGLEWHPDKYRLRVAYFENRTKDLIQFLQTSQFTAQARNLAAATIRGIELEGHAAPLAWLEVTANYSFQWAKDRSGRAGFDGKFLPGRPRHQLHAGLRAHYRWAHFFADIDFIDENFLDAFNALKVSQRTLLGLGFSLQPWKWLQAGFEVKNLLNQQIEDVVGFPVPGRLFFGKVGIMI